MNMKNDLFKHCVRAAIVVLTSLVCYATVASTAIHSNAPNPIAPPESMSGQWMLEQKPGVARVYLTIHRRTERGGQHSSSSDIKVDALRGLSTAQATGNGSQV